MDLISLKRKVSPEQVLTYFGYEISPYNTCMCPNHKETKASLYVNEDFVFCFGCKWHANTVKLAQALKQKHENVMLNYPEIVRWLNETPFTENTLKHEKVNYRGAVPQNLIEYWRSQLRAEHYVRLETERLLTKETVDYFNLGWRPDYEAFVLPYYRGVPGQSEIDIVQFRMPNDPKYIGLKGHSRGSIMNVSILEKPLPYVVVLFGAFDPILAHQDGVHAVGTSGACPFKKTDKERVQNLFKNQTNIVVVPDNTPTEFEPAYKMAEWVGGRVAFFPEDTPAGTDYIDYRKLSTPKSFLIEIGIEPLLHVDQGFVDGLFSLITTGDRNKYSHFHINAAEGMVASDIAKVLALRTTPKPFTQESWKEIQQKFYGVRTKEELQLAIDHASEQAHHLRGGW